MRKPFYLFTLFIFVSLAFAQTKPAESAFKRLPKSDYLILRDSCNQLDVVFISGAGGSLSLEGRSVGLFSSFVDLKTIAAKSPNSKDGFIMWQKNGREFITGDIYLQTDSNSYLLFKKDGKEYFNLLTSQGASFLRSQKK